MSTLLKRDLVERCLMSAVALGVIMLIGVGIYALLIS